MAISIYRPPAAHQNILQKKKIDTGSEKSLSALR